MACTLQPCEPFSHVPPHGDADASNPCYTEPCVANWHNQHISAQHHGSDVFRTKSTTTDLLEFPKSTFFPSPLIPKGERASSNTGIPWQVVPDDAYYAYETSSGDKDEVHRNTFTMNNSWQASKEHVARSRRRDRDGDDAEDEGDDRDRENEDKYPAGSAQIDRSAARFACPYWKFERSRCSDYRSSNIAGIKSVAAT